MGNISSYRNINHAYDVANALILISEQENGGDYVVCGDDYLSVKDIIINIYREGGLNLHEKENSFYIESEVIIEFNSYNRTFAEAQLTGKSKKLNKLGWTRYFSGNKLFKDLLT